MTARDFCYWLQGFIEVNGQNTHSLQTLTFEQFDCVKRHLSMVFAHDIDPKAGGCEVQSSLNKLHGTGVTPRC